MTRYEKNLPKDRPMAHNENVQISIRSFWEWLFQRDSEGDRGVENLFDLPNFIGLVLALCFAVLSSKSASLISSGLALPIAAVLIAVSFAWAGRSTSILQDKEFSEFIIQHGAPAEGYLYSFQLAFGIALLSLIVSGAIAKEIYIGSVGNPVFDEVINRFLLILFSWVAARECWGVISFSNKLAIQFYAVRKEKLERVAQD